MRRSPLSSRFSASVSLLPLVVGTTTIALAKSISGTLSASCQSFQSFANAFALVMTEGASFASFSFATEPDHSLPGFTCFFWACTAGVWRPNSNPRPIKAAANTLGFLSMGYLLPAVDIRDDWIDWPPFLLSSHSGGRHGTYRYRDCTRAGRWAGSGNSNCRGTGTSRRAARAAA